MVEYPLISVDDHIIEPPNVWQDRLPNKYKDRGPRIVVRESGPQDPLVPQKQKAVLEGREGEGIEFWAFEDLLIPTAGLSAAISSDRENYSLDPISFEQMRPGCYDPVARLEDLDSDGILASLPFPSFPRMCGQTFLEAKDRDLGLACVQAYNDYVIDEWCGAAPGRYIPMSILPLWDPQLMVAEIQRVAAKGSRAITFSENPAKLGLPSVHDTTGYWDPVFTAAAEAELPLCLHIGSSSDTIRTSVDAPMSVYVGLVPLNSQVTLMDWLLSGVLVKHPNLKLVLSEGGIGWIPYILERTDFTWEHQGAWTNTPLKEPPSTQFKDHVYGCFIDDAFGVQNLDAIGVDNCMIEVDYPHSDSSWPHTQEVASKHLAGLSDDVLDKILRRNAERVFRFEASGIGDR